jgi:hypothetical protein
MCFLRRNLLSAIAVTSFWTMPGRADEASVHASLAPARAANTAAIVAATNNFIATLDATQLSETVYPLTLSSAEHWSNLPGVTRNGPTLGPTATTTTTTTTGNPVGGPPGSTGTGMMSGTPPAGGIGMGGPGMTGFGGGSSTTTLPTFTMSDTQRAAALALAQAALSDTGFATITRIRAADDVLASTGASGYGSGMYHVAILGTPSTTAPWMLQIGGHHLAYNITYNAKAVSATPMFIGTEPPTFSVLSDGTTVVAGTVNGSTLYFVDGQSTSTAPTGTVAATIAPLEVQRSAVYSLLSLIQADTTQAAAAKLSGAFDDVTMGAASSGNDTDYPFNATTETAQLYPTGTTNRGVLFTSLTGKEQAYVINAIAAWVRTQKSDVASELYQDYITPAALAQTYIAYAPGTSGTADFSANPNLETTPNAGAGSYFRIDGPRVWIEAVVQQAIVFRSENWVHYHTLWRDKTADYGACFSSGADAAAC